MALFAAYMIAANLALSLSSVDRTLVAPWTRANAAAAARLCSLAGVDTVATGTRLTSGEARLSVLAGCNGVHALAILLGAILAFPAGLSVRAAGIVLGTIAVFGFNLIRLVNLVVVARYRPAYLELFHVYIWQTLIVVLACLLFVVWAHWAQRSQSQATTRCG